tara:strand:- start:516 stop:776 length:261 start_codon:yes stop_codon:yes gene_type:complete
MQSALVEVAKQVPALVVMAFVVFGFLRAMSRRDIVVKTVGDTCREVQRDSIKVMQENTRMLGRVVGILDRLSMGEAPVFGKKSKED